MISQLLLYSLKASVTLILLYAPYTLLLQRERFFRLNRIVLLGILLLSLILPLCNISGLSMDNAPLVQVAHQQMTEVGIPVKMSTPVTQTSNVEASHVSWFLILAIIFSIGMVSAVILRCMQLGILSYTLTYRNLWTKNQENGTIVCCRNGNFSPFSWMNNIVISESDWEENHRAILLHETGHIHAHHSYDMLLLMLCQAIQWYNPFVWMLGNSLTDVHEYEADDYVLRQGVDLKGYQQLLISKAIGHSSYSFANSLCHSLIGKRITMMQDTKYNLWRFSKVLYILPVTLFTLSAFATSEIVKPVERLLQSLESDREAIPAYVEYASSYQILREDSLTASIPEADRPAQFRGGKNALLKCLHDNIYYPKKAAEWGIQGSVVLSFVVEKDGTINNIEVEVPGFWSDDHSPKHSYNVWQMARSFEQAAIQALKHTSGLWEPAEYKGRKIRVRKFLPIVFGLEQERHSSLFGSVKKTTIHYRFTFYA